MFKLFNKKIKTNKERIVTKPSGVILLILDGFGISPMKENNSVYKAKTPNIDFYEKNYPKCALYSSGNEVGLPFGEPGNSEVGHLNIGAGRIVYQPLLRVSNEIESGGMKKNATLEELKKHLRKTKGQLHLLGLLGPGGVHSHIEHLFSILLWCKENHIKKIALHLFTDGRDSPPRSAEKYLYMLDEFLKEKNIKATIASISGRFYAMDREKKWERVEKAYRAIIGESRKRTKGIKQTIEDNSEGDEFLIPHTITDKKDLPLCKIKDGDALFFFNIRSDRTRELVSAFSNIKFNGFKTKKLNDLYIATLTEYDPNLNINVVFPEKELENTLGEILSKKELKQIRIAESVKYPHVTYFFNGGAEHPFKNEKRVFVPSISPSKYKEQPEMSAEGITKEIKKALETKKYKFILANYANPDMIGHTGKIDSAIKGIEFVDSKIKEVLGLALEKNYAVFITADHGNAEEMVSSNTGSEDTEHNIYPVPLVLVYNDLKKEKAGLSFKEMISEPIGALADIAPTILDIMNIEKPLEMTGESLIDSLN